MTVEILQQGDFEALAKEFSLGTVEASSRVLAGTVNTNYRVQTSSGVFFLRVNRGKSQEDVEYEVKLLLHFKAHGVETPLPLPCKDGTRYYSYHGMLVSVFPWQAGRHVESATISDSDCEAIGRALAQLHASGDPEESLARETRYNHAELRNRFTKISQSSDPRLAGALSCIEEEFAYLDRMEEQRSTMATGLIHADLFPDNVLLDGERIILLDFEQACTGSFACDIAVTINAWCFSDHLVPSRIKALLHSYWQEGGKPLTDSELLIELRATAMRFTITRVTDVYLPHSSSLSAGPNGKDFRRFLMRLKTWQGQTEKQFAELAHFEAQG